jgi:hypothetical protein
MTRKITVGTSKEFLQFCHRSCTFARKGILWRNMRYFAHTLVLFFLVFASSSSFASHQSSSERHFCGTIPYPPNTQNVTPDPIIDSPQVWSFVSEPNLHPMKVQVNTYKPGTSSGLIFAAPYTASNAALYGQPGALILDNNGIPIWFRPLGSPNLMNTDFRVQNFKGKQVLTFWQGTLATPPTYTNAPAGSSEPGSCYYILDNTYKIIKTVRAKKGFTSDVHEFLLTPQNRALLLSTKAVPMDLTPYGGPQNGYVQDFAIQEIDLETNKLLFFWSALQNVPLTDSYEPASSASSTGNIWDAYHFNSLGLTDDENDILVSGRNTWTIYRIHKPTKSIVWRLGGKQSNFCIESDAQFSWQHDARLLPNDVISLFDDNCCESSTIPPDTPPAHGLLLQLDLDTKQATLKRAYYHDPNLQVASQGNMQSLKNGNKFIGWGQSQYYAEYAKGGNTVDDPAINTLYDAQMPGNNFTYRAYRHKWVGTPFYPPSIAVKSTTGQITVYASWNGSTETKAWEVFAGKSPHRLSKIKTVKASGFETEIVVANRGPYFKVKALNRKGKVIGVSKVTKVKR